MQTFGRCTPLVWKILQTINVFFLHICLGDECFINFHFKWGGWKGTRSFPNAIMSKRQSILGTHFTPRTQFKGNLCCTWFYQIYLFEQYISMYVCILVSVSTKNKISFERGPQSKGGPNKTSPGLRRAPKTPHFKHLFGARARAAQPRTSLVRTPFTQRTPFKGNLVKISRLYMHLWI